MFDKTMIHTLAEEMLPRVTAHRRHLHMYPEVSFQEKESAAYISAELTRMGIPHECNVGGTYGIVARLQGMPGDSRMAFRADFDALPIQETCDVPYASRNPGVMHACGHDSHAAVLLGFAEILKNHPEFFSGEALLIFQPAEETPPGGAKPMADTGFLAGVQQVYALHVAHDLPAGVIGVHGGPSYAASDHFRITVTGKGGHGSLPHETTDTLTAACDTVMSLNTIISRKIPATDCAVISTCSIHSETVAYNILPGKVVIDGTVRTFAAETADTIEALIQQTATGVCRGYGADCLCEYERGYPVLINDAGRTAFVAETAEALGLPVQEIPITMGGEDFAYFLQQVPGCIFRLGVYDESVGAVYPLHNSRFKLDESVLTAGLEMFLGLLTR